MVIDDIFLKDLFLKAFLFKQLPKDLIKAHLLEGSGIQWPVARRPHAPQAGD